MIDMNEMTIDGLSDRPHSTTVLSLNAITMAPSGAITDDTEITRIVSPSKSEDLTALNEVEENRKSLNIKDKVQLFFNTAYCFLDQVLPHFYFWYVRKIPCFHRQ